MSRPTPETDARTYVPSLGASTVPADFARKLERELAEAREDLKHIEEYGTEEINAAVELRQKLATALVERDEAIAEIQRLRLDAQREAEQHDRMIGELEKVYKSRDEWATMCGRCSKIGRTQNEGC